MATKKAPDGGFQSWRPSVERFASQVFSSALLYWPGLGPVAGTERCLHCPVSAEVIAASDRLNAVAGAVSTPTFYAKVAAAREK